MSHTVQRGITLRYTHRRHDLDVDDDRYLHISPGIFTALYHFRPDVVTSAEMGARSMIAALYCRIRHIPLIVGCESTMYSDAAIGPLRLAVRRRLVRVAERLWSNGTATTELLVSYGAERERIDEGMTGVDTRFLFDHVQRHLAQRDQLRREIGVEGTVFLFVGQLIPRKGAALLADALVNLSSENLPRSSVIFVGDGPERQAIAAKFTGNSKTKAILTGFVQLKELPKYLAAADVFVLPTLEDVWALAALEASVAGLPQIFSRRAGASQELLSMGCSGRLIDPADAGALRTALMEYIMETPPRLEPSVIAAVSEYYSPEQQATRAWKSICQAAERNGPRGLLSPIEKTLRSGRS
jgi:glycosyltransferase involved in cell wall biosynthesis